MQNLFQAITSEEQCGRLEGQKQKMSHDSSWTFSATSSTGEPREMDHVRRRLGIASRGMVVTGFWKGAPGYTGSLTWPGWPRADAT